MTPTETTEASSPAFVLLWGDVACLRLDPSELKSFDFEASIRSEEDGLKVNSLRMMTGIRSRIEKATDPSQALWCDSRNNLRAKFATRVFSRLNVALRAIGKPNGRLEDILRCGQAITQVATEVASKGRATRSLIAFRFADAILKKNPLGLRYEDNVTLAIHVLIFGEIANNLAHLKKRDKANYTVLTEALAGDIDGESTELSIVRRASKACFKGNLQSINNGSFGSPHLRMMQLKVRDRLPQWLDKLKKYYSRSEFYTTEDAADMSAELLAIEEVLRSHGIPDELWDEELIKDLADAVQHHSEAPPSLGPEEPAIPSELMDAALSYFRENEDKWVYPEELAEAIGIDFLQAQSICEELFRNGRIETP